MIPVGYLAKRIAKKPAVYHAPEVADVYSVSNCVSDDFTNYIPHWKHNGWWFFDSPEQIYQVAKAASVNLADTTLFYYEMHDLEFNEGRWLPFSPEPSFTTAVQPPLEKSLQGFDVVTFSAGTSPECSPLSCNGLMEEIATNSHSLLDSMPTAVNLLNQGKFSASEPGPHRIFAVYSGLSIPALWIPELA